MRTLLTAAALGSVAVCAAAIVAAQDSAEAQISRSYDLSGFESVSVVGPHHVVISVGPAFSIRADGPQQTLADTELEVEDGRLKIQPIEDERGERHWQEYWERYRPATFYVTMPRIAGASLAGGGDIRVDRVEGGEFAASVAGSGGIDVASLRVEDARFSIAGSGDLMARGSARRSRISIAGSGSLRASEVASDEASISIAGSGNVALTVQNDARVSIIGSGDVEISGRARCSVARMGGGRVRCGDNVVG